MRKFHSPAARSLRSRLLGCSMAVLAASAGGAAWADCLPATPVYDGTTNCSGVTNGGLVVGVRQTTNIAAGASLNAVSGDAAAFTATTDASVYYGVTQTLNVKGAVNGGSTAAGVLVLSDPAPYYYYDATTLNIVVDAGGSIQGSTAIRLDTRAGSTQGVVYAAIDNSGLISASSGPAIVATDLQRTRINWITNRAGGFIGGVSGSLGSLTNDGVIDGGTLSAVNAQAGGGISLDRVTNTGSILSNSATATISAPGINTFVNSGRIANQGSGAAIDIQSGGLGTITNQAGGVIESGGPVAVRLNGFHNFVNRGQIVGSVTNLFNGSGYVTWDLVGGTIQGDVLLGSLHDTLIVGLDTATGGIKGVTGRIDGGGGQNVLLVDFAEDVVLDGVLERVVMPTNFQTMHMRLSGGATATFNGEAPDGLVVRGQGLLKTTGVMTSNGQALTFSADSSAKLSYNNSGSITATFATPVALNLLYTDSTGFAVQASGGGLAGALSNTGTITSVNGHGLLYGAVTGTGVDVPGASNSGTITAYGIGLSAYGTFENAGRIVSTNFIGVSAGNYNSNGFSNTGAIEGRTVGLLLSSGNATNSGSITGAVGVTLGGGTIENLAGGVITGTTKAVNVQYASGGRVLNAGVINGDVDFRPDSDPMFPSSAAYADLGGKLNGNLLFTGGNDTFIADVASIKDGRFTSITGVVDAGAGRDRLVLGVGQDYTGSLDPMATFETVAIEMRDDASATLVASKALDYTLDIIGQGKLDLTADITVNWDEAIYTYGDWAPYGGENLALSITSRGAITYAQQGNWVPTTGGAIQLREGVNFENLGVISVKGATSAYYAPPAIAIMGGDKIVNGGTINLDQGYGVVGADQLVNSGVLQQVAGGRTSIGVNNVYDVTNSGTISTGGVAILLDSYNLVIKPANIVNSGLIQSTGANAIQIGYSSTPLTLENQAGGKIVSSAGLAISSSYGVDKVRNDGEIVGGISLGGGDDRIENYGSITGDVSLGDGNDTFVQWVGGKMDGTVDGGYGLDTLLIDSTGGGAVSGGQFVNFESFKQIGGGTLVYEGLFTGAINLDGGGAEILAGTLLSVPAILGGAGDERVVNGGQLQGSINLGAGADSVENRGYIDGAVRLGTGDDVYFAGLGSGVRQVIDGGQGSDTYIAELDGAWGNLLHGVNFERLGLVGSGSLDFTLAQNWESISLAGVGLTLHQGAYSVGAVTGGDAAEAVSIDRDIVKVDLGGGDDALTLGGEAFAGAYAGGAGVDSLTFTSADKVVIPGSVTGFETVALAGGAMDVAGALGATGDTLTFQGDAQTLSVLAGGSLSGTVDLGAGNDVLRLAAGGQLLGTVLGGAGSDLVAIDLTADLSLRGDQLQQFETLQVTGTGALSFTGGAAKFERLLTSSKDLTVAVGSTLDAGALAFDGAANLMTVAGGFTGAVDLGGGDDTLRLTAGSLFTGSAEGGAGSDRLELALGGTDAAPVALGGAVFTGFETLSLQSGVVSVSGDYGFDSIQVSAGRLIGLAGSRLRAGTITVAQGATFGSAGAVTGDIAVSGILSPGASPGVMTVTGNVSLATGSTALFELSDTASDQLRVSGRLTIAQGSTLKLAGSVGLTPGRTLDLIVADGGITGAFGTVEGQGNLHLRQSTNRLQAVGLFTTDQAYSGEVSRTIATLNAAFLADKASAAAVAAMPALIDTTTGKSAPTALARLTPQAYASAVQLATEDALSIVDASRGQSGFAPDAPGLFGFGQAITGRRTLDGDAGEGVASGKITSSGGLAGVGYGVKSAWFGGFVGYLDGRQRLGDLDARTTTESFVVGAQGQVRFGDIQLNAMVARDKAQADTQRAAPGGASASGDYDLESWIGDIALSYSARLNADWIVQPRLGASYVSTKREGLTERGGGAFALTVDGDKASAWFVDAQVEVIGGQAAGERLHPYASLGVRTRGGDDAVTASASMTGLDASLAATGLERAKTLGTAGVGLRYDVSGALSVSAGYQGEFGDGGRQAGLVGLRWSF